MREFRLPKGFALVPLNATDEIIKILEDNKYGDAESTYKKILSSVKPNIEQVEISLIQVDYQSYHDGKTNISVKLVFEGEEFKARNICSNFMLEQNKFEETKNACIILANKIFLHTGKSIQFVNMGRPI